MDTASMSAEEIRRAALEILDRELGPAGTIRFLQQFDRGRGDYTRDREQWLGNPSLQELADEIVRDRNGGE
ncbi:MAG TPA: hypothetical protein VMT00_08950 [Thermoanaerobaculia bacterium]|nr:hypothetical protein [Thermoanaerobaculia bacterium]